MNTMIQLENTQDNQTSSAIGFAIPGEQLTAIDPGLLSAAAGGKNFLQRYGEALQKGGEAALAVGAVGTVIPVVGETGVPEGIAAGGGAAWLLGAGAKALGGAL
jgi:hypothetical protein